MIRSELYKICRQRSPRVLLVISLIAVLAGPIFLAFRPPDDADLYPLILVTAATLLPLGSAYFGSWLLGYEYRQGTIRRLVTSDGRRNRVLQSKAIVGAGVLLAGFVAVLGIGWGASALVAGVNGQTLPTSDLPRQLGSMLAYGMLVATFSFGLTAILKSGTQGLLTSLGVLSVFSGLLSAIPKVGPYLPGSVLTSTTSWLEGAADIGSLSMPIVAATLAGWLVATTAAAHLTFTRRDA